MQLSVLRQAAMILRASLSGTSLQMKGCRKPLLGVCSLDCDATLLSLSRRHWCDVTSVSRSSSLVQRHFRLSVVVTGATSLPSLGRRHWCNVTSVSRSSSLVQRHFRLSVIDTAHGSITTHGATPFSVSPSSMVQPSVLLLWNTPSVMQFSSLGYSQWSNCIPCPWITFSGANLASLRCGQWSESIAL